MQLIGGLIFSVGLVSIVLKLMHRELVILSWISSQGEQNAWVIRAALVVIGGILWFAGRKKPA